MRYSRRLPMLFVATIAACTVWVWTQQARAVHTESVKIETGRIICNAVNPHDYPVEVRLAASTVYRRASEHLPPEKHSEVNSVVRIPAQASEKVEFHLPEDFSYTGYPQVLVESVERISRMEF